MGKDFSCRVDVRDPEGIGGGSAQVNILCLTENSNRDDVRVRAMRLDKQSGVRDEADTREVTEEGWVGIGNVSD